MTHLVVFEGLQPCGAYLLSERVYLLLDLLESGARFDATVRVPLRENF